MIMESKFHTQAIVHPLPDTTGRQELARKGKLIMYSTPTDGTLDTSVVTVERYSCFGATLFPGKIADLQLAAGVTSAGPREGKSTVAANLAAFFATDGRDDTVLVDLCFRRPVQHQIFGAPPSPGIMESTRTDKITLCRTAIKKLWLLPLGFSDFAAMDFDKVIELRDSLETLKRHFRFIVLDLPSALQSDFPGMISSQLDGYILVVSRGKTRVTHLKQAIETLNEKKVMGFVLNHARRAR